MDCKNIQVQFYQIHNLIIAEPNKIISQTKHISLAELFDVLLSNKENAITITDKISEVITSPFTLKIQPKIKNIIAKISIKYRLYFNLVVHTSNLDELILT